MRRLDVEICRGKTIYLYFKFEYVEVRKFECRLTACESVSGQHLPVPTFAEEAPGHVDTVVLAAAIVSRALVHV